MDLNDLRLFLDVARLGGFAAAARHRNVDPSVMSRAIATLESRLGFRLFQRTTRKVTLTEAGALYLDRTAALIEGLDAARDDARSVVAEPTGVLRLTASHAFGAICLATLLPEFRRRFPALAIDLILRDDNVDLVAERVDLAVRLGPVDGPGLIGVKLFDTHYRVCASQTYLATAPALERPGDLISHRCLLFAFPEFRSRWTFRFADQAPMTVPVDGDLVTTSALVLRDCAIAGMGPALLPHWLIDGDVAAGRLVNVFPGCSITATSFDTAAWLIYPSQKHVPAKVKAMASFLAARLASSRPAAGSA